ncbi:MAG: serine hydroxymethyltransferase [Acutalibacteraceae bacterium]|nr:serine hydroxymethyltransferase [Oscillospiraceae bacterium]
MNRNSENGSYTPIDEEINAVLKNEHPYIAKLIEEEGRRQEDTIQLIASENFPSDAVRIAAASPFVSKYSEGYPAERTTGNTGRYYGGCEVVDKLEEYCCDTWRRVFDTDYHVNVQPHSGSSANFAAYMSVLKAGDTILAMNLSNGGHLTHGSPVNFSGKLFNNVFYDVGSDGFIDYDDIGRKVAEYKPDLVLAGASAYSRKIDFARIKKLIDENSDGAKPVYFMVDMSHIAGLVAAGDHPSPFGVADIITTTTHKTLRGTRGGLIFCRPELAKKIDGGVFPCCQGGALQHIIAAKAVTAEECLTQEYKEYIHKVVRNADAMCREFIKMGYDVVSGGTENHMFLIDLSKTHPELSGNQVQHVLESHNIILNKNCVPNEKRSPVQTSGVRIGTPAMTTKGYGEEDFIAVAHKIDEIIRSI